MANAGELSTWHLDNSAELAETLALVTSSLLLNDAPPLISVKPTGLPIWRAIADSALGELPYLYVGMSPATLEEALMLDNVSSG